MYPHCLATWWGRCSLGNAAFRSLNGGETHTWPGPCPMLLGPRMAIGANSWGRVCRTEGPASAVFAELFNNLGGFPRESARGQFYRLPSSRSRGANQSLGADRPLLVSREAPWAGEKHSKARPNGTSQANSSSCSKSPTCPHQHLQERVRAGFFAQLDGRNCQELIRSDLEQGRPKLRCCASDEARLGANDWYGTYATPSAHHVSPGRRWIRRAPAWPEAATC